MSIEIYCDDFEATTAPSFNREGVVRVWLWHSRNVGTLDECGYGTNIDTYIATVSEAKETIRYFHNLKYDGAFILDWLLKHGYSNGDGKTPGSFATIISDMGQFYAISVMWRNGNTTDFRDSLKKIPMSVCDMAVSYKLSVLKGDIDYNEYRSIDHQPTDEELAYIRNDTLIVASVLKKQMAEGMTRLTVGSDALAMYQGMCGGERVFRQLFPVLDSFTDSFVRKALRGGYVYANPAYTGKKMFNTVNLDVNSLYPDRAMNSVLPYGAPIYGRGKAKPNAKFPLFIQHLSCNFRLKPGKLPTIQLKNTMRFCPTEYISHSGGESVELFLTSVDLGLMCEHYDVYNVTHHDYLMFRGRTGLFDKYVTHFYELKSTTTDVGLRSIAKLYLNSLIGKFSSSIIRYKNVPELVDGQLHFKRGEPEYFDPIYTAVSAFVTANARFKTITTAQSLGLDKFLYSDTDSIHALGSADLTGVDIHPTRLGAWKNEGVNLWEKVLRAKTYIRYHRGKDGLPTLSVTCAGMPSAVKASVREENFAFGQVYEGKLNHTFVPGGALLKENLFSLNP